MIMFPNRAEFEQHFLDNHLTAEDRVLPCLVVSVVLTYKLQQVDY